MHILTLEQWTLSAVKGLGPRGAFRLYALFPNSNFKGLRNGINKTATGNERGQNLTFNMWIKHVSCCIKNLSIVNSKTHNGFVIHSKCTHYNTKDLVHLNKSLVLLNNDLLQWWEHFNTCKTQSLTSVKAFSVPVHLASTFLCVFQASANTHTHTHGYCWCGMFSRCWSWFTTSSSQWTTSKCNALECFCY